MNSRARWGVVTKTKQQNGKWHVHVSCSQWTTSNWDSKASLSVFDNFTFEDALQAMADEKLKEQHVLQTGSKFIHFFA